MIHRNMAGTLENSVQLNQCVQFFIFFNGFGKMRFYCMVVYERQVISHYMNFFQAQVFKNNR